MTKNTFFNKNLKNIKSSIEKVEAFQIFDDKKKQDFRLKDIESTNLTSKNKSSVSLRTNKSIEKKISNNNVKNNILKEGIYENPIKSIMKISLPRIKLKMINLSTVANNDYDMENQLLIDRQSMKTFNMINNNLRERYKEESTQEEFNKNVTSNSPIIKTFSKGSKILKINHSNQKVELCEEQMQIIKNNYR